MGVTNILMMKKAWAEWAPGVWTLGGQGNSLAVSTGEGIVLVDAGPGGEITARMIACLRELTDLPLSHIVYSHGHMGYNNGVRDWLIDASERGHPAPLLVAHARLPARYRRYRELGGLGAYTNTRQFRAPFPVNPPAHWYRLPDITYQDELLIGGSLRQVFLMHAPSETDDATALWLPDCQLLYGSCAMIKAMPNVGTPYRIYRDPMLWADTLVRMLSLKPKILVPEFGKPLNDPEEVREALTIPMLALRWLREQVVIRMNQGMQEWDILHDLELPEEIFGHRFLKPGYGCVEYITRDIWRSENGWWNRNPTMLHPCAPLDAADARYFALPDPERVLAQAQALVQADEWQRALHVLDLLALASPNLPWVVEARELKAQCCDQRVAQVSTVVSQHLYKSSAEELRGQAVGSGVAPADRFEWT
jgi:uncharacterized sulfatase